MKTTKELAADIADLMQTRVEMKAKIGRIVMRLDSNDEWINDHRTCTHRELSEEIERLKERLDLHHDRLISLERWKDGADKDLSTQEDKIKELEETRDKQRYLRCIEKYNQEVNEHNRQIAEEDEARDSRIQSLTERVERLENDISEAEERITNNNNLAGKARSETRNLQERVERAERNNKTCDGNNVRAFDCAIKANDAVESLTERVEKIDHFTSDSLKEHHRRLSKLETKPDDKAKIVKRAREIVRQYLGPPLKCQEDIVMEALSYADESIREE